MARNTKDIKGEMRRWYQFRSKDGKQRGIILARSKAAVVRFAGYPVEQLIIEPVTWNGSEFLPERRKVKRNGLRAT